MQTNLEAERGLSQLEMMARGLQQRQDHQEPERCKPERRPRTKERRQTKKSWEKKGDSLKPEVVRTTCGCVGARPGNPASIIASSTSTAGLVVTSTCKYHTFVCVVVNFPCTRYFIYKYFDLFQCEFTIMYFFLYNIII
jgi:hypothetical protein